MRSGTLEKPEATQRSDPEGAPDEPSAPHGAETAAAQPGQTTQNDGLPYGVLSPFSTQAALHVVEPDIAGRADWNLAHKVVADGFHLAHTEIHISRVSFTCVLGGKY